MREGLQLAELMLSNAEAYFYPELGAMINEFRALMASFASFETVHVNKNANVVSHRSG